MAPFYGFVTTSLYSQGKKDTSAIEAAQEDQLKPAS
jgi:hypothetical protein